MVGFYEAEAGWMDALAEAPTFRPTVEQFADPLGYIRSIQKEAAAAGGLLTHSRFSFTTNAIAIGQY